MPFFCGRKGVARASSVTPNPTFQIQYKSSVIPSPFADKTALHVQIMASEPRQDYNHLATKAWVALSQLLPSRNPDCDYWWNLTGMHLSSMLEAADYRIEKQYEALLFHYHWMVPFMGSAPGPANHFNRPSEMSLEGLPIEYSWKWNICTKKPVVRYAIEPKHKLSGRTVDPCNNEAFRELLHNLQCSFSNIDLTWTNHFLNTLCNHGQSKDVCDASVNAPHSANAMVAALAAEFNPGEVRTKSYFMPRRLGTSEALLSTWKEAISEICPVSMAATTLYKYLNSVEGKHLSPTILAIDNIAPTKSRLKLYFQSPYTSFSSIRETMTLGNRISIPETQLQDLRSLIVAVAGLECNFPEDAQLPIAHEHNFPIDDASCDKTVVVPGCGYYFDIASHLDVPVIKFSIRVCVNGPDDFSIGRGITTWMHAHGRGDYCHRYLSMLEGLSKNRRLHEGKGIHTYISCIFNKDGNLDVYSYLGPTLSGPTHMLDK